MRPPLIDEGLVVVTEGIRSKFDPISRMVAWATGSWWTHCFMVTGPNELTEAWVPRVRRQALTKRLSELREQDRAYVALEFPGLSTYELIEVAEHARSYNRRWYDVGQAALFALGRTFKNDGSGTLICSRLITAAFYETLGRSLFDPDKLTGDLLRRHSLMKGECVPNDFLHPACRLRVVAFSPSTRIPHIPSLD